MNSPQRVFTGAECRKLDQRAIDEFQIPGITLMRRAGQFAWQTIQRHWPDSKHIKVYCGSGNNAGDGYIVAGIAINAGHFVTVEEIGESRNLRGDAKTAFEWYKDQCDSVPVRANEIEPDVVVDALLGTGVSGSIRENYQIAIDEINASNCPVLAIDLPSGLDPDTGQVLAAPPVQATVTTTFIGMKMCLVTGKGVNFVGQVLLSTLGVPDKVFETDFGIPQIPRSVSLSSLPKRLPGSYKNQSGSILVVGGDLGTGGAALLTAESALRTGAGLISVITRPEHVGAFLSRLPELMVRGVRTGEPIQSYIESADVIAVGPGLGQRRWGETLLDQILESNKPKVIDADALNILATREARKLHNCILTPHPGEAARLLQCSNADIENDRVSAVKALSRKFGCQVVLKGAGSLVSDPEGHVSILAEAVPALATGGSGDVLTGITATSLALQTDHRDAAEIAVYLHAKAGKTAYAANHPKVVTASDIAAAIQPWS